MINAIELPSYRVIKRTLGNGMDVLFHHDSKHPFVAVNLWYHVGSKNEERDQRGFAHLFEHLMFEGSKHYPGDFFQHLQRLGASINGSTSSDRTNYYVDIPSAHVEIALAMESDRMANLVPALTETKLRVQKDVVKNEYRQNYANRPYGMVWPLISEALFPPLHPYNWMTIGVMEDLEPATLDDVSSFFRRFYVPSNASLAIVGDIDEDLAMSLADRYFGAIPGGTRASRPWTPEVRLEETREIELYDRVELDRLYWVWPTVPQFEPDDAALGMLGDLLTRGRSSRLYRRMVIELELAQDVSASQWSRELAGSFVITATLRPGRSLDEARSVIDEELRRLVDHGITIDEVERIRNMKVAGFVYALEHIGGFGGVADRLNAYNVFRGDPNLITSDYDRFLAVTAGALSRVTSTYLLEKPRVSLSVKGIRRRPSVTPLDRSVPPTSGTPVAYRAPVPRVETLKGGIPVWLVPTSELPTLAATILFRGGATAQPQGREGIAQSTLLMLDEGTRNRSAAEIALLNENMGTTLSANCGWDGGYVSFKSLSPNFRTSLSLAVDVVREPIFPEDEWSRIRGQSLASLQAERDKAESRAYRALLSAIYNEGHPYRHPIDGTEASVATLTRDDLINYHRQHLVPGHAAVVVAGHMDPDAVLLALEEHFEGWSGPGAPIPSTIEPSSGDRPRILILNRPGAPQAVVRAGHVGMPRSSKDFESTLLLNQILGGQFDSRLNHKLREEKGYTYGVRSHFDCRRGAGPFSVSASLQTDRLADAIDDLRAEIEGIRGDRPPTREELDDARRALVEGQTRQFETPNELVSRFVSLIVHNLPPDHHARFPDRLNAVTLDSVIEAAQRRLRPESLVIVVVADLAQVEAPLKGLGWADVTVLEE
jgi:predicted Zn-dependent peptidase